MPEADNVVALRGAGSVPDTVVVRRTAPTAPETPTADAALVVPDESNVVRVDFGQPEVP